MEQQARLKQLLEGMYSKQLWEAEVQAMFAPKEK